MNIAIDRFFRLKQRLSAEKDMQNQRARLDERLAALEKDAEEILAAATQTVDLPTDEERWWPWLVEYFGSEDAISHGWGSTEACSTKHWRWSATLPARGEGGGALSAKPGAAALPDALHVQGRRSPRGLGLAVDQDAGARPGPREGLCRPVPRQHRRGRRPVLQRDA